MYVRLIFLYLSLLSLTLLQNCQQIPTITSTATSRQISWNPSPGTSWQIQLQGEINTSIDAELYVIDLFDTPQSVMDELHAVDRMVVCYFSAGSWEEWRSDAEEFPEEVIGIPLADWPGEYWLDIRHAETRKIMEQRLDLAQYKGCDGVDPDNVDSYTHETGYPLTGEDQLDYNRWLATKARQRDLTVGLKNDLLQIPELVADFDWVINEQCFVYDECELLQPFIEAGKPVFTIEYEGNRANICRLANDMGFDTLFKTMDLLDEWFYCRNEYGISNEIFLPLAIIGGVRSQLNVSQKETSLAPEIPTPSADSKRVLGRTNY